MKRELVRSYCVIKGLAGQGDPDTCGRDAECVRAEVRSGQAGAAMSKEEENRQEAPNIAHMTMTAAPLADAELTWIHDIARRNEANGVREPSFHWTTVLRLHATIIDLMRTAVRIEAQRDTLQDEIDANVRLKSTAKKKGARRAR
jgi:hypothetical protein